MLFDQLSPTAANKDPIASSQVHSHVPAFETIV